MKLGKLNRIVACSNTITVMPLTSGVIFVGSLFILFYCHAIFFVFIDGNYNWKI